MVETLQRIFRFLKRVSKFQVCGMLSKSSWRKKQRIQSPFNFITFNVTTLTWVERGIFCEILIIDQRGGTWADRQVERLDVGEKWGSTEQKRESSSMFVSSRNAAT